jgi:hypothetical protein
MFKTHKRQTISFTVPGVFYHINESCKHQKIPHLSTEAVESASLALECVDDVERSDGLSLGVLCVCDGITDDRFEEGLEDTTSFFIDHG